MLTIRSLTIAFFSAANLRQRIRHFAEVGVRLSAYTMSDIRALEYPTVRVPYEVLNKKFRIAQKALDREVAHVQTSLTAVEKVE